MAPRTLLAALAFCGLLFAHPARAGEPLFGGTPVAEQSAEFGGGHLAFSATVYTAVYNGAEAGLPDDPLLTPLAPGESLFVYLVHNTGAGGEVDLMALVNPDGVPLWRVGYLSMNVDGFANAARVDPALLYAGLDSAQFGFSPNFGGRLTPGKWALVYFRGPTGWQPVQGYVGLMSGQLDEALLLGPAPSGVMNPPPVPPAPEDGGGDPGSPSDDGDDPADDDTGTDSGNAGDTADMDERVVESPLLSNSVLAELAAGSGGSDTAGVLGATCGALNGAGLTMLLLPFLFVIVRRRP